MNDETYVTLLRAIRAHSGLELSAIRDAGRYGADSGFAGFTYTNDGARFYRDNADTIWALAADTADDLGAGSVPELVGQFARADMADTAAGFSCLLAWFALEETGRYLDDRRENRR
jgi:hypothetical protein